MHRCGLCMEPSGIPGRAALQRQPTHFSWTTLQLQWFVGRLSCSRWTASCEDKPAGLGHLA